MLGEHKPVKKQNIYIRIMKLR